MPSRMVMNPNLGDSHYYTDLPFRSTSALESHSSKGGLHDNWDCPSLLLNHTVLLREEEMEGGREEADQGGEKGRSCKCTRIAKQLSCGPLVQSCSSAETLGCDALLAAGL